MSVSSMKSSNQRVNFTSLDVARWFIQENMEALPDGLVRPLLGAIRARDVSAIRRVSSQFDYPQLYDSPSDYSVVAQSLALLSKVPYPFGGGDQERKQAAIDKFLLSEKLCRITTRRLDHYWNHPDREDPVHRLLLTRARAKIDRVLGSVDNAFHRIISSSRFGPGMTVCSADSARTTPYYKLGAPYWSVTAACRPYADTVVMQSPVWTLHQGEVDWGQQTVRLPWKTVQSCRITFVPKDERTFRTIAIEPFGNVVVQLGVHEYLAGRLRTHAGIDIHDQKWNQRAAQFGSQNWLSVDSLSTIDLSMASDCVSPGLIRRLVRPQWIALLDDIRSKNYDLDGVTGEFSKWSSMGNGYTFALETLLFWAIAQVCEEYCGSSQKALAYGDDIIVSRQASLLTLQLLRYCGFRVNSQKTNVVGPFRESCGADFHSGVTVRPVYQKVFNPMVSDVFVLLNSLGKGATFSTDDVYSQMLKKIPEKLKLWGPPSESTDSHIHAPWWWLHREKPKGFKFHKDVQSHYHLALVFKPTRFRGADIQRCLTWLYNSSRALGDAPPIDRNVHPRFFPLLGFLPKSGDGVGLSVTQRSRGSFRVRSKRCGFFHSTDRSFFYLAMG